jgi:8-oxo-dGTP pyrophosphatase MutT (NUDIX family)
MKIPGVDYPALCVSFFCHDNKGRLLLAKRTNKARDEHGRWENGAGMVHFGDTVLETIRREVKEEFNTEPLEEPVYLGYRDVFRETSVGPSHWVAIDFLVSVDHDKVSIGEPDKFDDLGWFHIWDLPSPMHSQFAVAAANYDLEGLLETVETLNMLTM